MHRHGSNSPIDRQRAGALGGCLYVRSGEAGFQRLDIFERSEAALRQKQPETTPPRPRPRVNTASTSKDMSKNPPFNQTRVRSRSAVHRCPYTPHKDTQLLRQTEVVLSHGVALVSEPVDSIADKSEPRTVSASRNQAGALCTMQRKGTAIPASGAKDSRITFIYCRAKFFLSLAIAGSGAA
jgi:hypothetical protein